MNGVLGGGSLRARGGGQKHRNQEGKETAVGLLRRRVPERGAQDGSPTEEVRAGPLVPARIHAAACAPACRWPLECGWMRWMGPDRPSPAPWRASACLRASTAAPWPGTPLCRPGGAAGGCSPARTADAAWQDLARTGKLEADLEPFGVFDPPESAAKRRVGPAPPRGRPPAAAHRPQVRGACDVQRAGGGVDQIGCEAPRPRPAPAL